MKRPVVVVTGSNGWLGQSAISVLTNKLQNYEVIAVSRNINQNTDKSRILHMTFDELLNSQVEVTGLVHTAFVTKNFIEKMGADEYSTQNRKILDWLNNLISSRDINWAVTVSSGAVDQYLKKVQLASKFTVEDLYGKFKLEEENLFLGSRIPRVAVGRLWAASGRFMKNYQIYALGQFIEAGLKGNSISISSQIPVYRRYVDGEDFMHVLILSALDNNRISFDSGGVLTSIENLAQQVVNYFKEMNKVDLTIKYVPSLTSLDNSNYFSNSEKFSELQKIYGISERTLLEQIDRTFTGIKSNFMPGIQ